MFRKIVSFILFALLVYVVLFYEKMQEIGAGIAIILIGMIFLEKGFKYFTGGPLEEILKKSSDRLWKSISLGVVSTAITQSSGLISVIAISFLSAGLMDLAGGIGVVFGANIGTTTGAWLISLFGLKFKISAFAMPFVIIGAVFMLRSSKKERSVGYILVGVGFIFLGIHYLKESFETFKQTVDLAEYSMTGFVGLIVYTFIGIVITVIMQSSHATLALVLTALSVNQISYENGLAFAVGANIGTTVVAIIGSISANVDGKRLAGAHLIFNVITAIIAIAFMHHISLLVDYLSVKVGIAATDYTLKLSMFHSLFNVIGIMVMIPFMPLLVKFLTRFIKEQPEGDIDQPKYISKSTGKYTQAALAAAYKEAMHLFDNAFEIIAHTLNLHRGDILSDKKLKKVVRESSAPMKINIDELYFKKVKGIYSQIIEFTTLAQSEELSEDEVRHFHEIKLACRYIVEIIKSLRNLQGNMAKYIANHNEEMRKQYNTFRVIISKIIREVYKAKHGEDLEVRKTKLRKLLQKAEDNDVLVNGMLDRLIRDKLVTPEMASSLMNDSATVKFISKNLIKIAELLYLKYDTELLGEPVRDGRRFEVTLLEEPDVVE